MFQNSFTSNSSARRFLVGFVAGLALLLLPGIFTAYYMGPAQGDLSRIGRLGERYFSMHQQQAPLQRLANPPTKAADILVLGDSFAAENVWQSHVTHLTGLTTHTYHYDDVACIDPWIRNAIDGRISTAAKILVIATVERKFIERFSGDLDRCQVARYSSKTVESRTLPVTVSPYALFPMDIRYLFNTVRHHRELIKQPGRRTFDNTVVVDLARNDLFSNAMPDRLLYFSNDDSSRLKAWSPEKTRQAVANLKRYERMATDAGMKLVVFVFPDKSTVYSPWIAQGQFPAVAGYNVFEALAENFGTEVDVRGVFREKAATQKDFYAPNDSHPSLDGYRFIGELIAARLRRDTDTP